MTAASSRRPPAVARVLERVTATVREHEMFPAGELVLVCVSGGPDSVCLLESLVRLRRLFRIRTSVFHFDHRLRPDSAKDVAYVRRLAAKHGLVFEHVEAVSGPPRGASVEMWAREERGTAALAVARESGAARIATGHTLDDQAETVLMRALSGSGAGGVAGIPPVRGPWVRPLFDVRRSQTQAFCRSLGLRPRLDPSNVEPRFLRNALRLRGLPALELAVGRDVREALARTGALLREDDAELTRQMEEVWDDVVTLHQPLPAPVPVRADLRAAALRGLAPPIAGRLVAKVLHRLGALATRADVLAVVDLAAGRPGRGRSLSAGLRARRDRGYVRIARPSPEPGITDGRGRA
jgi:tRNA(Ile)-lysidine synthase